MVFLIGLGDDKAVQAAMLYLLAHSLFKGALFMVAGSVDHEAGTRDARVLSGLGKAMPITAAAGVLAALSMAGLPPFLGFIAKEFVYKAALGGEVRGNPAGRHHGDWQYHVDGRRTRERACDRLSAPKLDSLKQVHEGPVGTMGRRDHPGRAWSCSSGLLTDLPEVAFVGPATRAVYGAERGCGPLPCTSRLSLPCFSAG